MGKKGTKGTIPSSSFGSFFLGKVQNFVSFIKQCDFIFQKRTFQKISILLEKYIYIKIFIVLPFWERKEVNEPFLLAPLGPFFLKKVKDFLKLINVTFFLENGHSKCFP